MEKLSGPLCDCLSGLKSERHISPSRGACSRVASLTTALPSSQAISVKDALLCPQVSANRPASRKAGSERCCMFMKLLPSPLPGGCRVLCSLRSGPISARELPGLWDSYELLPHRRTGHYAAEGAAGRAAKPEPWNVCHCGSPEPFPRCTSPGRPPEPCPSGSGRAAGSGTLEEPVLRVGAGCARGDDTQRGQRTKE
ncbi:hypothetical protein SKAU_G00262080 [Synaphobranchus kaupii]|uniref:Uncharacterized protein n=1 Tax=Synaphobranchus kaupii TaxID=118154 RepID=A0A9Q1EYH5_SYNKA|nr:hypothetical protein SKAU_G00262080 [Synaphobranchus kaupii]